jgi:outer membrane lipase/esterase
VCVFCSLSSAVADPININQLVVFGDSLSDNGNAAAALASAGQSFGNYAPNALTDGANTNPPTSGPFGLWIDQFATKFGLSDPKPFVVNTPSSSPGGNPGLAVNPSGTNFAVATAQAGSNPNFSPTNYLNPSNPQPPGTTDQVGLFSSFNGNKASPNSLYVFWAGANNIFDALAGGPSSFATFPSMAKSAADDIAGNIQTLAAEGGKYFVWLNLPPLGAVPYVQDSTNPLIKSLGATAANSAASIFNSEMSSDVSSLESKYGVTIVPVDVNTLFTQIAGSPSSYGFVDVKDAAWCGTDGVPTCASNNPNGFAFWDFEHPTTATDSLIAGLVDNDVSPLFSSGTSTSAVPEPSVRLLCALGLALLALRRRATR